MMGKNSTTSNLDFLLLEEVSDKSAEIISGGKSLTLDASQTFDLGDPFTAPFDILTNIMGSVSTLTGALGIKLPDLPMAKLPELPKPPSLPMYDS
ncbi:MAG: hypothetical protein WBM44_25185 [Waterburya sp.]